MSMQRILVATDLRDGQRTPLAYGFELASALRARVHVVHVLQMPGVQNLAAVPPAVYAQAEVSANQALRALTLPYAESDQLGRVLVRHGDPVTALLGACDELHPDLVIVGSSHRTELGRLLLGSVAEGMLRRAPCPVLVVR